MNLIPTKKIVPFIISEKEYIELLQATLKLNGILTDVSEILTEDKIKGIPMQSEAISHYAAILAKYTICTTLLEKHRALLN